jgi:hypothetical protein
MHPGHVTCHHDMVNVYKTMVNVSMDMLSSRTCQSPHDELNVSLDMIYISRGMVKVYVDMINVSMYMKHVSNGMVKSLKT